MTRGRAGQGEEANPKTVSFRAGLVRVGRLRGLRALAEPSRPANTV